jgi:uncharacterized protein YggL (DUF469 family)
MIFLYVKECPHCGLRYFGKTVRNPFKYKGSGKYWNNHLRKHHVHTPKTVKAFMDRILRLNEFFVEGGKQDISHVLLHITEPSTPEEMHKGYFFAIAEINQAETKYITRLQELIDQAENDYYELPDVPGMGALEQVLKKMNQEALGLAKANITMSCIVGAIRDPEISFTYYGEPHMLLFYKNREGVYQKMDLIHSPDDESENEPTQLFSQIIQGKISPNDFLFAGTPHISEFFSHDRLQKHTTMKVQMEAIMSCEAN